MKKEIAKRLIAIIAGVLAALFVFMFIACGKPLYCNTEPPFPHSDTLPSVPEEAILLDKAERWAKEDFLTESRTNFPFADDGLPFDRCFFIYSEGDFNRAFKTFPVEVTFPQNILVIYTYTDIYYRFGCELQTITNNAGELTIEILHDMAEPDEEGGFPPSTSYPTQRCLVIKMSACTFESVKVKMNYEHIY